MNDADRLQQVESLFHNALARPSGARAAFLEAACGGDAALLSHVQAMLAAHERSGDFMDRPAMDAGYLAQEPATSLVGQRLGSYRVLAPLGKGGMGEVFLAEDTRLGRRVALKLLPKEFAHDAERVRRFEREARAVSLLNHPNIITLHEVGQDGDAHFLVTELVEGQTLRQRLGRGVLPPVEALAIVTQVAAALAAAHEAGIVHRDIKPENLMLRPDGLVKVLDFGLAKLSTRGLAAEASQAIESQTEFGQVLGTIQYMSPEQALGEKVDQRSDIFSLGAVFYELVTGKAPFHAATPAASYDALLNKACLPVRKINPALPSELDTVIARMLKKDRSTRYQAVSELQKDLQWLRQKMDDTKASGRLRLRAGRRRRAVFALAGLAILSATGLLWLALSGRTSWLMSGARPAPGFQRTDWQPQQPFFEQVELFRRGEGGVAAYRIPALAVTKAGTILAVVDACQDRAHTNPGNTDLAMRRSTDLGRTWEPITYIQNLPEGEGACEPSLLADYRTGRVFCFYFYSPSGVGLFQSEPGDNSEASLKTIHPHVIYSDDDGRNWNAATPTDLNPRLKDSAWAGWYAVSGHGIQTRTGRLLQPFAARTGPGRMSAFAVYSDDGGATWNKGNTAGTDIFDPKAIEMNDGAIMLNMRGTSRTRNVAISRDGGLNFSAPAPDHALIDPTCNADIIRYAATQDGAPRDIILFSNPADLAWRLRLTVRASYDEGRTWPDAKVIHRGPSGYSVMAVLPDGTIGLLYEQGERHGFYEKIVFARFNLEWMLAKPPLLTDAGAPSPDHEWFWAWFDAGHSASVNGPGADPPRAPLMSWNDIVPPSQHSLRRVAGNGIEVRPDAINSLPAVHFAGKQSLAASTTAQGEFGPLPNGFTLLLVARLNDVTGSQYLLDSSAGAGIGLLTNGAPVRWGIYAGRVLNGPNHIFPTGAVRPGVFQVHTLRLDGAHVGHYINGELAGSGVVNDGGVPLHQWGLTLGANYKGERASSGDIAEILCYNKPLDDADRRSIERYLLRKYALTHSATTTQ